MTAGSGCEPNFKKPRTKAHRGIYGRGAKAECLKLHSLIVRSRGRCEYDGCGSPFNLQCSHVIRRGYAWTASDEQNAWCLCSKHHRFIDLHPHAFMEHVEATIGRTEYDRLWQKARAGIGKKFDWPAELLRLRALWKQVAA